MNRQQWMRIALVCLLGLVFLSVFLRRSPLQLPIHVDEWHHLSESRSIFEGKYVWSYDSYRVGFHLMLLPLWILPHPAILATLIPGLLAALAGFFLFRLMRRQYDTYTGLGAVAIFGLLGSSFNLLGKDLLVPLGASLPFLFLYLDRYIRWIQGDGKSRWWFFFWFGLSSFIYPLSGMMFLPFLLIWSRRRIKKLWPLLFVITVGAAFLFLIEGRFDSLLFWKGWSMVELNNSIFELLPLSVVALGIVGTIYCVRKKKLFWPAFSVVLVLWVVFFRIFGVSPLVPYQRVFFYFALSIVFLAVGGFHMLGRLRIPILVVLVLLLFMQPSLLEDRNVFIDDLDYRMLSHLAKHPDGTVLTHPGQGIAVYPITGMDAFTTIYFENMAPEEKAALRKEAKYQLLHCNESDAAYFYTDYPIECGEVLRREGFRFIIKNE